MKSFKDSQEFAFRRYVRAATRKSRFLTKSQRVIVAALFDLWSHHKEKGRITPKRAVIARKTLTSERTVASTLAMLRDAGVMIEIGRATGGRGKATAYRMNLGALLLLIGAKIPDCAPAGLVEYKPFKPARSRPLRPVARHRKQPAYTLFHGKISARETVQKLHGYIENNNRSSFWPPSEPVPWLAPEIDPRGVAA
ncbi:hypothetical protein [Stappia indica]|uniref:hypothetical protein n=1 Tax=Stappia indica TaxID=538381 RepID=UPI001CD6942C|nr:hypothetical protein [Stappia indica]MCA1298019.1 hypothetical protein [Stappia indica]